MNEREKREIVPLNRDLYSDFSIIELENRLELEGTCWLDCGKFCSPVVDPL
jgi:hypothetical protein